MVGLAVSKKIAIQSSRGPYDVCFEESSFDKLVREISDASHFIIDRKVASLYSKELKPVLAHSSVLFIEATEGAKSFEQIGHYVSHLLSRRIRRGNRLVAIGGGIIQDITCFLAAILLRGLQWSYYPTSLLAQADSCIGSKSSINFGEFKNILGTFTPPGEITICPHFLDTLCESDLKSGIGEMLKVHAIDGPQSFDRIVIDYDRLLLDRKTLMDSVCRSLLIKKRYIEEDEFDKGSRLLMNYGHSFGHAIESATHYEIPHGIAVTIGVDMANFISVRYARMTEYHFDRMHPTLKKNYMSFSSMEIPLTSFLNAIFKDKKNPAHGLILILPNAEACVERISIAADETFENHCREYFSSVMPH